MTRSAADTVEGLGGRESVVVVAGAASVIELTHKSGSTLKSLLLLDVGGIAVAVAAAGELALFSRVRGSALAVAWAAAVAGGADISASKAVSLRKSTLSGNTDDVVDLLTEAHLVEESTTISLRVRLLIAQTSKGKRNILLRNIKSGGLKLKVTSLLLRDKRHGRDAEELLHGDLLHISITILARLSGVGSEGMSISEELIEGDGGRVLLIHRTDPATRPARSNESAEGVIHPASISRVIGRSRGGDVNVVRNVLLVEERARIASLHEDDEVLVKVLSAQHVEHLLEVASTSETTAIRHGDDISVAVIIIIEENVILSSRTESLAAARLRIHTHENREKVISGSIGTSVILGDTRIDVDVLTTLDVEVVVDLTRERILAVVSDIISHEDDDPLIRNAKLMSNLISMADRSLVPVVAVGGGTSNKNNPGVLGVHLRVLTLQGTFEQTNIIISGAERSKSKESNKQSLHCSKNNKKK